MKLQKILTLLQNNKNHSDWVHSAQTNGTVGYCQDNVNLRLSSFLVLHDEKIQWESQLFYRATTLCSARFPATDITPEDRFLSALDAASRNISDLLRVRQGRDRPRRKTAKQD